MNFLYALDGSRESAKCRVKGELLSGKQTLSYKIITKIATRDSFILFQLCLQKSPKQPRLLQKARKHLDEVQAAMPSPYCSRAEFVAEFTKAIQGTKDALPKRLTEQIDSFLRILTAYGYVRAMHV